MGADAQAFLKQWHRIAVERDIAAIEALLAEGVSLGAPPYWTKLQGRGLVNHLLGLILHTIEGFTYHREWMAQSWRSSSPDAWETWTCRAST